MDSAGRRRVIVPHLDGDVVDETAVLEELLLWLRLAPGDEGALARDPGGVFDAGTEALGTLRLAMLRTTPVVAYAPDRRWEHVHLQLLDVPAGVVEDYGIAATTLALCRSPRSNRAWLADDLDDYAASCSTSSKTLVDVATRFHSLVAIEWSDDHETVGAVLDAAPASGRGVVLTPDEDAAYLRLCDRFVTTWHANDRLARWMYGLDHHTGRRSSRHRAESPAPWQRNSIRGYVR